MTSQLSGDLLAHLSAVSEGSVKMYVVKCLLEQLPEQHHGKSFLCGRQCCDCDVLHLHQQEQASASSIESHCAKFPEAAVLRVTIASVLASGSLSLPIWSCTAAGRR